MNSFVLDNSVTAAWCFEDQSTAYTEAVLQAVERGALIFVPAVWRLEVVNALVVAERRKKLAPEKADRFLKSLDQLAIQVDIDGVHHVFAEILRVSRRFQRSAYDASYLELAMRLRLPFATKDEPLRKAAEEMGISFFQADPLP